MAVSGKNASFKFAGQTYDSDDCLQSWDLNRAVNDVVYQCGGYDKHAAGTKTITFSASLALAATDTTKLSYFAPGTTGAFEAHPAGDTPTYIEAIVTKATVISSNISAPINGVVAVDLTFGLDDITVGAAV